MRRYHAGLKNVETKEKEKEWIKNECTKITIKSAEWLVLIYIDEVIKR